MHESERYNSRELAENWLFIHVDANAGIHFELDPAGVLSRSKESSICSRSAEGWKSQRQASGALWLAASGT